MTVNKDPNTGQPYDAAGQPWATADNTGKYVGVPDQYKVQQGSTFDPRYVNYAGYSTSQPVYGVPQYSNADVQALWGKGKAQVWDTQYKLYSLGFLPSFVPGTMDTKTEKAALAAFEVANKNGTTLEGMLQQKNPATGKPLGGGPGSSGPTSSSSVSSSSQTQKSISLTSREAAMSVLGNALSQELGRQPTQDELTRFTTALNRREMANPTVTKSTSTTSTNASSSTSGSHQSNRSSSSTSGTSISKQGNVDTGYEATQFAKSGALAPERNRFQDSQYMDVIAQMIGAK
jgi:hypothetical protein